MQTFIVQREPADSKPVDSSVTTPILAGQILGLTAALTLVLGYASSPSSFLVGVASADQDTDATGYASGSPGMLDFWVIPFGNNISFGRTIKMKLSGTCNPYVKLYASQANPGFVTSTAPGSAPVVVGFSKEAGTDQALISVFC